MNTVQMRRALRLKTLLTVGLWALSVTISEAQFGTVGFKNFFPNNHIYDGVTQQKAAGSNYKVALYCGADPFNLSAAATTDFLTGTQAGLFNGGTVELPPYPIGAVVFVQVKAWSPAYYPSYEIAVASGDPSVVAGASSVAMKTLPVSGLSDLGGFYLYPVSLPVGSLQVTLSPAGAVSAGAQWRVDDGAWQNSGATVYNLAVGSHTVSFATVSGWTTPASQSVYVYNGPPTATTGLYTVLSQTGVWTSTSQMNSGRMRHTGTLLPNGKVLVTGGWLGAVTASAELYDPVSPGWTSAGVMSVARQNHAATLLPDGRVLVTGGYDASVYSSAELFNPTNGSWTAAGTMSAARRHHSATLLTNGKVLIAGGYGSNALSSADLFDATTGAWVPTGAMNSPRYACAATLLPSGKVLVAGGNNGGALLFSAELYDPSTGSWTPTGAMNDKRVGGLAVLLTDGKVLVAGGYGTNYLSTAELYDPATGQWSYTGAMNSAREWFTATLLPDGKVLVAGGYGMLASAELYNPGTRTWTVTGTMNNARMDHTASLLPNGKVLVAGAGNNSYTADLYSPDVVAGAPTVVTTSPLASGRVGLGYVQILTAIGSTPAYNWTLTAGALPMGLNLSSAGTITGTPTMATNASFTVQVAGNDGLSVTQVFDLTITGPPTITTVSPLASGIVGAAYNQTLAASGGVTPYTWSVAIGDLPVGLSLSSAGAITGTPVMATNAGFTVRVAGGNGLSATQALSLTISGPPLIVTTSPLPSGVKGSAYGQTLVASGGVTPYTWSVASGGLPLGLNLTSAGTITGTPEMATNASFTVRVAGGNGLSATQALSLTVTEPLTITSSGVLPLGMKGAPYSQTLAARGGVLPYHWTIISGGLPIGLNLSSDGAISGTSAMTTNVNFTVQLTDHVGLTTTKIFNLTISAPSPPRIYMPGMQGTNFNFYFTFNASGYLNTFRVEAKAQVTDSAWTLVYIGTNYAQPGMIGFFSIPATNSTQVFRVYDQTAGVASTNALGYLKTAIQPGSNWVVNPFTPTTNTLGAVIPNPPDGTEVLLWENGDWSYYAYESGFADYWFNEFSEENATAHPLPPAGTGFILWAFDPFTLTLIGSLTLPTDATPTITMQPQNCTNLVGTTATFTVGATGTSPLAYQWRRNSTNLSNTGNVFGALTNTLTLAGVVPADAANYSVVITDGSSSITSSVVTLTVIAPATVSLDNLTQIYDGTAKPVSVITVPQGLLVTVTYNGSANAPTNVGDYTVVGTVDDAYYQGSATNTLVIVIPDNSTNVTAAESATLAPGQSATATTAPTGGGQSGVAATATNDGGGTLLVVVANYATQPAGVPLFQAGASYMDLWVSGADGHDSLMADFYYPSTISGDAEASLALGYWDGTNWIEVRSSGGSLPAKDTTDNLDGTVSGGRFTVLFDPSSTPLLTGLTGTVFAVASVLVAPPPPQLTGLPLLPNGAFQFAFTSTPGAVFSAYCTTNLSVPFSHWTFLGSLTDSPPGQFQFTDLQATNFGQRFYRVQSP